MHIYKRIRNTEVFNPQVSIINTTKVTFCHDVWFHIMYNIKLTTLKKRLFQTKLYIRSVFLKIHFLLLKDLPQFDFSGIL
jgi:hypothetical protein